MISSSEKMLILWGTFISLTIIEEAFATQNAFFDAKSNEIGKPRILHHIGQSPFLNCTEFKQDLIARKSKLNATSSIAKNEESKANSKLLDLIPDYDYNVDQNDVVVNDLSEFEKSQIKFIFDPLNLELNVANADDNPELISGLTDCQLDHVLRWKELIARLKISTIKTLMMDKTLAARLETSIPYATIASLIQVRTQFVKNITDDFPAKRLVKRLIKSREFIQMLPVQYIADVVESKNVRHLLDEESISVALSAHPNLPEFLSQEVLDFGSVFLREQEFISILPCAVYMNAAMNSSFVNRVDTAVLRAFSSNKHFWGCIPVEVVRYMMATTKIGARLTLDDMLVAATTMAKAKKMDLEVVKSIFKIQFPQVVSKAESSYYDWFNNIVNTNWVKYYFNS